MADITTDYMGMIRTWLTLNELNHLIYKDLREVLLDSYKDTITDLCKAEGVELPEKGDIAFIPSECVSGKIEEVQQKIIDEMQERHFFFSNTQHKSDFSKLPSNWIVKKNHQVVASLETMHDAFRIAKYLSEEDSCFTEIFNSSGKQLHSFMNGHYSKGEDF